AGQDWYRIHSDLRKVRSKPAFQSRCESLYKSCFQLFRAQDAASHVPDCAFFRHQVADVFGKKIDLGAGRFPVRPATSNFTLAGHRPVVLKSKVEIGRAHVSTPVTWPSRMPSSA